MLKDGRYRAAGGGAEDVESEGPSWVPGSRETCVSPDVLLHCFHHQLQSFSSPNRHDDQGQSRSSLTASVVTRLSQRFSSASAQISKPAVPLNPVLTTRGQHMQSISLLFVITIDSLAASARSIYTSKDMIFQKLQRKLGT